MEPNDQTVLPRDAIKESNTVSRIEDFDRDMIFKSNTIYKLDDQVQWDKDKNNGPITEEQDNSMISMEQLSSEESIDNKYNKNYQSISNTKHDKSLMELWCICGMCLELILID